MLKRTHDLLGKAYRQIDCLKLRILDRDITNYSCQHCEVDEFAAAAVAAVVVVAMVVVVEMVVPVVVHGTQGGSPDLVPD